MVRLKPAAALMALAALWAAPAMGQSVTGAFEAPDKPLWAGEVFDLTLAWTVDWATFGNLEGELEWASEPLVAEPWGEPALRNPPAPGASRAVIEFKTRAMVLQPGEITVEPASQVMRLQTGVVDMDEYQRAVTETRTIQSAPGLFNIRPLPPAPEGFTGAVGQFTVTSEVEAEEIRVGESLTWRVTLAGTGNWPAIRGLAPRQVSRDFEVVGAPELEEAEGAGLFERTLSETVTLIPQRAGRYVLSDFEMVVFDPQAGRFERLRAEAITLDVLPGPNGDLLPPEDTPPDEAEDEARLPPMLKGKGSAVAPPAGGLWIGALLALPLMLVALWGLLALWRAHQTDPDRIPRAAHRRLAVTLSRLALNPETPERRRLVRAWQADAALRWRLGLAAPAPDAFPDPEWRALWAQADQFLYARSGVLADDWTQRAQAALAELGPPPPFRPVTALRRGSLLPAAAMASFALVVLSGQAQAQDMTAQDMTAEALRQSVAEAPLDWRARHNLSIALAAQDQWEEAAGHAAIAWLHNPADAQTRQLWMTTGAKAGYSLEPGASVPRPRDWRGRAIAIASPATWRWLLIGFAWVAAAGLAAALYARYRPKRHLARAGLAVAALAVAGTVISATALSGYGVLASDKAVLVWGAGPLRPLPVDTPAEEAEIQLAGGTAGRVDKAYLGWRRVKLADGRSGWTRAERLLPVWDSPN